MFFSRQKEHKVHNKVVFLPEKSNQGILASGADVGKGKLAECLAENPPFLEIWHG